MNTYIQYKLYYTTYKNGVQKFEASSRLLLNDSVTEQRDSGLRFSCNARVSGYCQFAGAIPSNNGAISCAWWWYERTLLNFTPTTRRRRMIGDGTE